MSGAALRGALAGAVVMLGSVAWADEPLLPAPRSLVDQVVGPISYVRPDPYAVWQNYAVDRRGYFRPLVTPSYGGPRYVATGEPFPWWQNHPRSMQLPMGNSATFGGSQAPPVGMMTGIPDPVITPAPKQLWARMPYAEK